MNIALIHFRVGETDGVSLEMEKWKIVLEELGHDVCYISGTPLAGGLYIPELNYRHPENEKFVYNGYEELVDFIDEESYKKEVLNFSKKIEIKLKEFVKRYNLELFIPNNIWSLGWSLPAAIALSRVVEDFGIPCFAHHHDFYWERERYGYPTCSFVRNTLDKFFPPRNPLINHVVINQLAKEDLKKKKAIEAEVVPNVFNFEQPLWEIDEFNNDLREKIGCKANDIIVLQATRVTERKAIELAISMVGELIKHRDKLYGPLYDGRIFTKDNNIVFFMPGLVEAEGNYLNYLKELSKEEGIILKQAEDLIGAERKIAYGKKQYSLWDAYAIADVITYPSIIEGWGNQFLEALFAKKPMAIFEYPVYRSDIKDKGFRVASFGDSYTRDKDGHVKIPEEKIREVTLEVIRYLKDGKYREEVVEKNFNLGKKYFSYDVLKNKLKMLLNQNVKTSTTD